MPDSFVDFVLERTGKGPNAVLETHCRRELYHAQLKVLLDPEFMYAYEHGIVFMCPDGIERRFYPRFFTYTADYPEKSARFLDVRLVINRNIARVYLASIRNLGRCPCPRCTILRDSIHNMGTDTDMDARNELTRRDNEGRRSLVSRARKAIYDGGVAVNSVVVENLLREQSLVPTEVIP